MSEENNMKYKPNKVTVSVRTGEPLEDELRSRGVTRNEQAELNKAIKDFTGRYRNYARNKACLRICRRVSIEIQYSIWRNRILSWIF